MVANRKVTGRASSVSGGLLVGSAVSMGMTLILSFLLALMISKEYLNADQMGYFAMGILIAAAWVGAATAFRKVKRMEMKMAMLNGGLYYLLLLAMTSLFFGGQFRDMGITLICILVGSGAGGIVGSGRLKQKPQKRYKKFKR